MRILSLIGAALAALTPTATRAQESPRADTAAPATASAVGVVFDSLRYRPLQGAIVRMDSSALTTLTDSEGRFRLDGIPPGRHFLAVEHPMLDTLAVIIRSPQASFAAEQIVNVAMSVPSGETLIGLFCSSAWRARGPAALVGRVREADTERPAAGAKVSLVWYELDVTGGVRRAPRVREATVAADGTYRICGLPAQLDGRVQVLRGALTSGEILIPFGEDLLALRSMSIAPPGAVVHAPATDSAGAPAAPVVIGSARLTGRVVNKSGAGLPGARVQLDGTTHITSTRQNGEFVLDSLPAGTQNVTVRLLGYAPVESAVDLSSAEPTRVTLTMEDFVPVLEAVRVTAQRERALDDVGFSRRKRMGMGWFMDGEAIQQRNAQYFSDIMRSAPGLRVTQHMGRQMIQSVRDPVNGCVTIWVDGTMWQQLEPGDVDDFVRPHELGAIEVYSPTSTPAEYQQAGRSGCSTIVAWTTRRLDRRRR